MALAPDDRRRVLGRVTTALASRVRERGVELDRNYRCEDERSLLLETLSPEQTKVVLKDLDEGSGNPREDLTSVASSALIAVNAFGAFIGRSHPDELLNVTLNSPRFERKFPISGVKAPPHAVPNLDVVEGDGDRAIAIESKLVEPWRGPPRHEVSPQYERPAEEFSAELRREIDVIRRGEYELFDAAQAIKNLLGLRSAALRPPSEPEPHPPKLTRLVLLHWQPKDAAAEPLCQRLREELERFRDRVGGGPVGVQVLSYAELWTSWQAAKDSDWLRAHGRALADRYEVPLEPAAGGAQE